MVLRGDVWNARGLRLSCWRRGKSSRTYMRSKTVNGEPVISEMPLTAEEFNKGTEGINEIEALLRAHPDTAYSLHEIEEALIGPGMNRTKHLDVFIANLTLLAPLLFTEKKIGHRVINGVPYFRWQG
jgi:hypothetical protein